MSQHCLHLHLCTVHTCTVFFPTSGAEECAVKYSSDWMKHQKINMRQRCIFAKVQRKKGSAYYPRHKQVVRSFIIHPMTKTTVNGKKWRVKSVSSQKPYRASDLLKRKLKGKIPQTQQLKGCSEKSIRKDVTTCRRCYYLTRNESWMLWKAAVCWPQSVRWA